MTTTKKNSPTHIAYQVREFKGKDGKDASFWTKIGSAWDHNDGKGCNIRLDCFPLNGEIVLRVKEDKHDQETGEVGGEE